MERGQAAWGEASKSGMLQVGVVTLSAEWREGEREWGDGRGKRDPVGQVERG